MPWKLLATTGGYIFVWLAGYSALLGPIAGILIADYWLIRRTRLDVDDLYRADGALRLSRRLEPGGAHRLRGRRAAQPARLPQDRRAGRASTGSAPAGRRPMPMPGSSAWPWRWRSIRGADVAAPGRCLAPAHPLGMSGLG